MACHATLSLMAMLFMCICLGCVCLLRLSLSLSPSGWLLPVHVQVFTSRESSSGAHAKPFSIAAASLQLLPVNVQMSRSRESSLRAHPKSVDKAAACACTDAEANFIFQESLSRALQNGCCLFMCRCPGPGSHPPGLGLRPSGWLLHP